MDTSRMNGIDPVAVARALGLSGTISTERVLGGADTAIWRIEHDTDHYALRVFRPGEDTVCEGEVDAIEAIGAMGYPVPRVHAHGRWHDRSALLLSWIHGRPVAVAVSHQPERAEAIGVQCGRMQARLHALPAPPTLIKRELPWMEWKGPHDARLIGHLKRGERSPCLIHLDFHPLNVMLDGTRISGVLDWVNAHIGDARADVARTATILQLDMGNPMDPPLLRPESVWQTFEQGWQRGYEDVAGPLGDLSPWYAWAGSVMQHDLAHRYAADELRHVRRWTEQWLERAFSTPERGSGFRRRP
jgi:aminoglycoside phosphotransferase (APT) family kinase protein